MRDQEAALTQEQLGAYLDAWPEWLSPLARDTKRLAAAGAWRDVESDAILVGKRSDFGYPAFKVILFPPLSDDLIQAYQRIHDIALSPPLLFMFRSLNGFFHLDLNVYGIPPSMAADPPLLDRSLWMPLDIGSGRHWRLKYSASSPSDLLFASRNVDDDGQVGYFMAPDGVIKAYGAGSRHALTMNGEWANLAQWMATQVASAT